MEWLLMDFAGVLGHHQSQADLERMTVVAGVEPADFWPAYWRHRGVYDSGQVTAPIYWGSVAASVGKRFTTPVVERLTRLDVTSWLHANAQTLSILDELTAYPVKLGLCTNAPLDLATAMDQLPWLEPFRHRFYSCRMGLTKPDTRVYHRIATLLDVIPPKCLLVDDRPENVAGAISAGMGGLIFTDARRLSADLKRILTA